MPTSTKKIKTKNTQPPFATADQIARGIRSALKEQYDNLGNKKMLAHLSSAVSDWLKSPDSETGLSALSDFSFIDPGHSFKEIWKIPLEIDHLYDGDMAIKIPAFNPLKKIVPPAGTNSMFCFGKLAVVDVLTGKPISTSDFFAIFVFENRVYPEKSYRLKAIKSQGNLIVIRITLVFFSHEEKRTVEIGDSSGLVAAIYRK
jgi:hypothetical protein